MADREKLRQEVIKAAKNALQHFRKVIADGGIIRIPDPISEVVKQREYYLSCKEEDFSAGVELCEFLLANHKLGLVKFTSDREGPVN